MSMLYDLKVVFINFFNRLLQAKFIDLCQIICKWVEMIG